MKCPLVLLTLALGSSAFAQSAPTYVIRNVSVISTTGTPATRLHDVVIRGRQITQLARPGSANPPNATYIAGDGKFLIPGLIDSHVHIKEGDPLFLFVANGVTTVQNMSGRPFHLRLRQQTADGSLLGPRIITTGPTTAEVGVSTVADVEKLVADQKAAGYDAIKQYGGRNSGPLTPAVYGALRRAAAANGMRLVGHAPRNLPFQTVLDERQTSVDHMEEIVYTHQPFARLLRPYIDLQFQRATPSTRDSLLRTPVPDFATQLTPEIEALAQAVKRSGIAITPNLTFFRNIQWMTSDSIAALMRAPELRYATPEQRLNWAPAQNRYRNAWRDRDLMSRYLARIVELQTAITLAFHRAGVPLMTGTDSEWLGAQPGFGLHTELELFVKSGLDAGSALRAATIVPAQQLQIADSVGSIEAGKIADVVLLDANPLADIRNTRRMAGVFHAGRWLPRAAADASLDSLARSYAPMQDALSAFMTALETEGAVAALEVYRESAQRALIATTVERVINSYGYGVIADSTRRREAIEIFRANAAAFPRQSNTWDSLAEAYFTDGRRELAVKYYRRVLELRPNDENATRMLRQLGAAP
jgi:tetratricopeptide (TPR) repeat protein